MLVKITVALKVILVQSKRSMWDINEAHFRRIDLNALIVFMAVMRERSVTKAAERLLLGQPAVSHALNNLRVLFDDPLFVRSRAGMIPTPRADAIFEKLSGALTTVHETVYAQTAFNPATAERTIRLGLPDDLEIVVLPPLVEALSREAPGLRLIVRPADFRTIPGQIDTGDIDIALSAKPIGLSNLHLVEVLRSDGFVCIYDPRQLKYRKAINMTQYLAVPHILVSANGELSGAIDQQLETLGHKRKVLMAAARFSSLPFMLKSMQAVANMPRMAADAYAGAHELAVSRLPFETPLFELTLVRHAREQADRTLSFVCDHLRQITARSNCG
jgi:LysR family transcriptional regulator, mexEF-oprN operon transcriptional activator